MKKIFLYVLLPIALLVSLQAKVPAAIESLVQHRQVCTVSSTGIELHQLPSNIEILVPGVIGATMFLIAYDSYRYNLRVAEQYEHELAWTNASCCHDKYSRQSKRDFEKWAATYRNGLPYNIAWATAGVGLCAYGLYKYLQRLKYIDAEVVISLTPACFTYRGNSIAWKDMAAITLSADATSLHVGSVHSADAITVSNFSADYSLEELELLLKACLKIWGEQGIVENLS